MRLLLVSLMAASLLVGYDAKADITAGAVNIDLSQVKDCPKALSLSMDLINAQDASIILLKQNNKKLEDSLAKETAPPLIPTWLLFVAAGVGGAFLGKALSH